MTYGTFRKNNERIQESKETGGSRYIHQNKPYQGWFQYNMAYGYFKHLPRRAASD